MVSMFDKFINKHITFYILQTKLLKFPLRLLWLSDFSSLLPVVQFYCRRAATSTSFGRKLIVLLTRTALETLLDCLC
jgi:hypothetical protein